MSNDRAIFTWIHSGWSPRAWSKAQDDRDRRDHGGGECRHAHIVRRDTGESYQAFLTRLAETSGIKTPTREALARLDRQRQKKTSNKDWTNPHDPDAKVTKMKDGRRTSPTRRSTRWTWRPARLSR